MIRIVVKKNSWKPKFRKHCSSLTMSIMTGKSSPEFLAGSFSQPYQEMPLTWRYHWHTRQVPWKKWDICFFAWDNGRHFGCCALTHSSCASLLPLKSALGGARARRGSRDTPRSASWKMRVSVLGPQKWDNMHWGPSAALPLSYACSPADPELNL